MNRIERKFRELKRAKQKAFIAFITAGYPDLAVTGKLLLEFSRIGVDIVELGVPFSDPMADGPVIQEASEAALKNKVNLQKILGVVRRARKVTQMPICLMSYYNPIYCFPQDRFVRAAVDAGVDGVIVPDLPPEEAKEFLISANKSGLDLIFFLAPTSTRKRIKLISQKAKGFIYYVSLTGVTGPRQQLPADITAQIRAIKGISKKPVCVGFGVSSSSQVRQINRVADGVIVGSAIIKEIKRNAKKSDLVRRVSNFILKLKSR
ncbi:MAG: tryptophan synthase subunit alpha [Candidatus Omnitrophota bacterium]|nr:tryptophan synthase subunit alpha [Candidatus Omnitrophota bacterium]